MAGRPKLNADIKRKVYSTSLSPNAIRQIRILSSMTGMNASRIIEDLIEVEFIRWARQ